MNKKRKNVIYAIVDEEDYDFVSKDIKEHNMQVKGWMHVAIEQMRKLRKQQKTVAS